MAKNTESAAAAPAPSITNLRLGDSVRVVVQPDVLLINTESGGYYQPGVPTPATVTATLLRRLQDGDLALA
ncbi:hypothetical protein CKO44_07780 [Rubrivivax gelatinosus]|uniref:hypothetical protein n=1 Tax=Rubrivivax gelatinosus TaxID=28068 RepID=UPI001907C8BE|nr:hypothetical protein [Rubrivivax gelatinosus]MBK1613368.1 hypothetical protein [Rubrivivax gelatinosus]